jgi:hypothetical protein
MADPDQTETSPLGRVLSSHPLVLLVGAAVFVVSPVAAVMFYLCNERIANLETKHNAEVSQIKTTDKAELLALTAPLNEKIADLTFRLDSIERRVPGSGPSYLDITTVTGGSDIRQTLSSGRYTSYDNDGFYVAVPPGPWKFEITNLLSLNQSMDMAKEWDLPQSKMLSEVLRKSPVFLWQGSSKAQVFSDFSGEELDFTFRPSIWVQHITSDSLKEQIEAVAQITVALGLKLEELRQKLVELDTKFYDLLDKLAKAAATKGNTEAETVIEGAKDKLLLNVPVTKQDKIKILEDLASSELTDYVLFGELEKMSSQNATWPLNNRILSIQDKGNVFYIQDYIRFNNVEIRINDGERHHVDSTSVYQEIFFFSRGKDGYLVKTLLPQVPDQADNFSWSIKWLAGLQIPIR